jgi:hypothetical protein
VPAVLQLLLLLLLLLPPLLLLHGRLPALRECCGAELLLLAYSASHGVEQGAGWRALRNLLATLALVLPASKLCTGGTEGARGLLLLRALLLLALLLPQCCSGLCAAGWRG